MTDFTLFFEPADLLLFRDHRPFDMGLQVLARSRFPGPSVFFGCLRTALLEGEDPGYFRGRPSQERIDLDIEKRWGLRLQGPLLARYSHDVLDCYYPMPFDTDLDGDTLRKRHQVKSPSELGVLDLGQKGQGSPLHIHLTKTPKGAPTVWLTAAGLEWWRTVALHSPSTGKVIAQDRIYRDETRIGIARERDRLVTQEGMFYVTIKLRFAADCGFAVEVQVAESTAQRFRDLLHERYVNLGGRRHVARVRVLEGAQVRAAMADSAASPTRLLLLTPTPAATNCTGATTQLSSNKALPGGGYDMAKRAPKPLVPLCPAGTVFFGEKLHLDLDERSQTAGYGMHTIGD